MLSCICSQQHHFNTCFCIDLSDGGVHVKSTPSQFGAHLIILYIQMVYQCLILHLRTKFLLGMNMIISIGNRVSNLANATSLTM
jgi:hypothetical protein